MKNIKVTKKYLEKIHACSEGIKWWEHNGKESCPIKVIKALLTARKKDALDWANWLIVRIMDYKEYVSYAIYEAEREIDIFEKERLGDWRPRNAIIAAKKCLINPSKKNRDAADAKATIACAAVIATSSNAAFNAAYAAVNAARIAAVDSKVAATFYATYAVYNTATENTLIRKLLQYGIKILEEGVKKENNNDYKTN